MNVLIEIGHPAHVHFFRTFIERLKGSGDRAILVTRDKEITNKLMTALGMDFVCLSKPASTKAGMLIELVRRWYAIWRLIGREAIDVVVSVSGISTALPARLRGVPNLNITDTEDAAVSNFLSFPFSNRILTPHFFLKDLGPRHHRYCGLQELAYLKNFNREGLKERLATFGMPPTYSIIRLIAYDAAHDWMLARSTENDILAAVEKLSPLGAVYITSQVPLSRRLAGHALRIPIANIHDVLAGASFFVGESPTMAVEAGILGTPSLLVSARWPELGNMVGLEAKGLLLNALNWTQCLERLATVLGDTGLHQQWRERASAFRRESVDVGCLVLENVNALVGRLDGSDGELLT